MTRKKGCNTSLQRLINNQMAFLSKIWGELRFFPSLDKAKTDCRRCLLNCNKCATECSKAPCTAQERKDHQDGYYSQHNMPSELKLNF